ncbi:MAG: VOC family protein [bacterium]|nr:VOC family protein [bacterium]
MALRWYTIVTDSLDPQALARWWAETLNWTLIHDEPEEAVLIPPWASPEPITNLDEWLRSGQGLCFVKVPDEKVVKNRLHIDLAPHSSQDREAEIHALIERGATLADIGQDEEEGTWTVLRDPEGNEFCVLSSRER